jgi:hypothetical protein
VEERVSFDRLVVDQDRPATSADLIALVRAFPREFDAGQAVPLGQAAVQRTVDGDEAELTGPVAGELDETRLDQVDRVEVPSRSSPRSAIGRPTASLTSRHVVPRDVRVTIA